MWERPSSQPRRSARAQTATRGGLNDGDDWELVHDMKLKAGDLQTFQHGTSADNAARTDTPTERGEGGKRLHQAPYALRLRCWSSAVAPCLSDEGGRC